MIAYRIGTCVRACGGVSATPSHSAFPFAFRRSLPMLFDRCICNAFAENTITHALSQMRPERTEIFFPAFFRTFHPSYLLSPALRNFVVLHFATDREHTIPPLLPPSPSTVSVTPLRSNDGYP